MPSSPLLQQLLLGLVVLTSTGTLVQDTKLNKALEVAVPLSDVSVNISSHLEGLNEAASVHTHVEQASASQDFSGIPRIQARDDHKRYILAKYSSRGNSFDGNSQFIWPSI
jgi:hypothetical protein